MAPATIMIGIIVNDRKSVRAEVDRIFDSLRPHPVFGANDVYNSLNVEEFIKKELGEVSLIKSHPKIIITIYFILYVHLKVTSHYHYIF